LALLLRKLKIIAFSIFFRWRGRAKEAVTTLNQTVFNVKSRGEGRKPGRGFMNPPVFLQYYKRLKGVVVVVVVGVIGVVGVYHK
jgi:hypothetical protein